MYKIQIFTYNLLTFTFAKPELYPKTSPQYFSKLHRSSRVISKIKKRIDHFSAFGIQPIFCFQESCSEWVSVLAPFFDSLSYNFISAVYSYDTMGVAIAYPNKYKLNRLDVRRPTNKIDIPYGSFLTSKQNSRIAVELCSDKGDSFYVYTYHMPVLYKTPKSQFTMARLVLDDINTFAENKPIIATGDWNFTPGSDSYNLMV